MAGRYQNSCHRCASLSQPGRAGGRRLLAAVAATLLAACLAGCGSISEQTAANLLIDPGRFNIYTCQDVSDRAEVLRVRQLELEQLMSRAAQGAGGEFVNAIAYRTEYAATRAELKQLAGANADKQCVSNSKFSSGRAIF